MISVKLRRALEMIKHMLYKNTQAYIEMETGRWVLIGNVNYHETLQIEPCINPQVESLFIKETEPLDYTQLPFHHLIINTTKNCNLQCKYCYFSAGEGKYTDNISPELIIEAITKSLKLVPPHYKLTVLFQGGEALMNFNSIKTAVESVDSTRILYQIQSNGTLFNREIARFMKKYKFRVSLSLDGVSLEDNKNRFGGNKKLFQNFLDSTRLLREEGNDFGIITVVNRQSISHLLELIDFYYTLDVHKFAFNLVWLIGRADDNLMVENQMLVQGMMQVFEKLWGKRWNIYRRARIAFC